MNNQYFDSGFTYGFIFSEIIATPSKCKKCGEYPKIWHYNNAWQVECDCGRVSDMLITTAVSNWNEIYGDGFNYTTVLDICKLNAPKESVTDYLNKQTRQCCCDYNHIMNIRS